MSLPQVKNIEGWNFFIPGSFIKTHIISLPHAKNFAGWNLFIPESDIFLIETQPTGKITTLLSYNDIFKFRLPRF